MSDPVTDGVGVPVGVGVVAPDSEGVATIGPVGVTDALNVPDPLPVALGVALVDSVGGGVSAGVDDAETDSVEVGVWLVSEGARDDIALGETDGVCDVVSDCEGVALGGAPTDMLDEGVAADVGVVLGDCVLLCVAELVRLSDKVIAAESWRV